MEPVVPAVLLFLAVASIVSGAPIESGIMSGDTSAASIVSGDKTQNGKLRYGNEICLPVILQTLKLYKSVLCLITYYAMTTGEMQVLQAY